MPIYAQESAIHDSHGCVFVYIVLTISKTTPWRSKVSRMLGICCCKWSAARSAGCVVLEKLFSTRRVII